MFNDEISVDSYISLTIFSVNWFRCSRVYITFWRLTMVVKSRTIKSFSRLPLPPPSTETDTLFSEMYLMCD